MASPRGDGDSIERADQPDHRLGGQQRGFRTRDDAAIGGGDRHIHDLTGFESNLTVPNPRLQGGQPDEREGSTEKGMGRIGDRDVPLAHLCGERGITGVEVSRFRSGRPA